MQDYEDFLRQRNLARWEKENSKVREIRALTYRSDRTYKTYSRFLEESPEMAANALICLIHQANFLLDQQLRALEKQFLKEGGFTERLYRQRKKFRDQNNE